MRYKALLLCLLFVYLAILPSCNKYQETVRQSIAAAEPETPPGTAAYLLPEAEEGSDTTDAAEQSGLVSLLSPIELSFEEQELIWQELPRMEPPDNDAVEQVIEGTFGSQVMFRRSFDLESPRQEQLCSCLEVAGVYYNLMLYADSAYDACPIRETRIDSPATIYAYNIILGANYAQRQYFCVDNGVPYLIAQIDCAAEADVDGDGWEESIYLHGTPMQTILYLWDVANDRVSYADINIALSVALECQSVCYELADAGVVFVAACYDAGEQAFRENRFVYRDGSLLAIS